MVIIIVIINIIIIVFNIINIIITFLVLECKPYACGKKIKQCVFYNYPKSYLCTTPQADHILMHVYFLFFYRTEKIRWMEAMQPKQKSQNDGEKIYEEWGKKIIHDFHW